MPRRGILPALEINGNGTLLKVESRPLKFTIHYPAESKLNPGRCGCISDLIKEECQGCKTTSHPKISTSDRYACLARDIKSNTWCIFHATHQLLAEIVSVGEKAKYRSKQIFEGNGPIFTVQRIGSTYGVTISSAPMPEEPFDPKPLDSKIAESIAYRSYWSKMSPIDCLPDVGQTSPVIPQTAPLQFSRPVPVYDWSEVSRAEEERRSSAVYMASSGVAGVTGIFQRQEEARPRPSQPEKPAKPIHKPLPPRPPANEEPVNLDHLDADADLWDDL